MVRIFFFVICLLVSFGEASKDLCVRQFAPGRCLLDTDQCLVTKLYAEKYEYFRASGNILYAKSFDSIGNWFLVLPKLFEIAIMLDLAIVVDSAKFLAFDIVVEPNAFNYQVGVDVSVKMNSSEFKRIDSAHATIVLSHTHWEALPSTYRATFHPSKEGSQLVFEVHETFDLLKQLTGSVHPHSCMFSAMFRWTVYFDNVYKQELFKNPIFDQRIYSVLHISTTEGENHRYDASAHSSYIIDDSRVSNFTMLCHHFQSVLGTVTKESQVLYIAGNSKRAKSRCKAALPQVHYAHLGLDRDSFHTKESPLPAIVSFLDYRFALNAKYVIHSGSSFVSTIISIRELKCESHPVYPYSTHGDKIRYL